MIDLHTHILPDWDDGARDWEETAEMIDIAAKDGIKKIVLTPHVFRLNKHNGDLGVLRLRISEFGTRITGKAVEFYSGAEVFVDHDLVNNIKGNRFSVNGSNYVFIEFPAENVLPNVRDLFYNLMIEGFIPIISHPERNRVFAERPRLLFELIAAGSLAQVTAKSITGEFGPETKRAAHLFLLNNLVHAIASDAHDSLRRPPLLSRAVDAASRIVGEKKATAMVTAIPQAILDNKEIPDCEEPVDPTKKRGWFRSLL
jgi:protein-tyrosine phosphatase